MVWMAKSEKAKAEREHGQKLRNFLQNWRKKTPRGLFTTKLRKAGGMFGMNEINMNVILKVFLSTALMSV